LSRSRRERRAQTPCGIFLIDKPKGPSSRDLLRTLARRLDIHRSGHCGTLDPLASGLVVVVSGGATRVQDLLTGHDKFYLADLELGARSATDDAEGPITVQEPPPAAPTRDEIEAALLGFRGEIDQVPPAFSAIHLGGERLYRMAREGRLPDEIPARRVRIDGLRLVDYSWPRVRLEVDCGSGTYIRSLARDLGEALGVGAYLSDLRRTRSGHFEVGAAMGPEEIEREAMISLEDALAHLPRLKLAESELERLLQGKFFPTPEGVAVAEDDLIEVGGLIVGRARPIDRGRSWRLKRIIRDPRDDPQTS
jgi:tRNA pseudouridine55 synthase